MKITKYMGMAFAIAALAACSNEDDLTSSWQNDPTAMKVNATVGSGIFSRSNPLGADEATQKAFNNGDEISIAAGTQNAVVYKLTDGTWTPKAGYLKWKTNSMAITAYYPVADGVSAQAFTLPTEQETDTKIAVADYMTYSGNQSKPTTGGELNIEMERKMARVIVKIEGFNNQYGTTVPTVENVKVKSGAANYAAGAVAGDVTEVTPFVQNLNGEAAKVGTTYTALVIPTTANSTESFITMTVAGTPLVVKGIPAMEAGKSYTYNLTIGKDAITVGEVTVTPWGDGTIKGGEAIPNSYAVPETHTIELTKEGTLTNDLLTEAIGDSNDLTLVGYMNDNDFKTMNTWFLNNMNSTPLKNIDLSEIKGLTAIPDGAFAPPQSADVTTLESVKLPATVTKIGDSAFFGATQLKSINIGTVTDIGQYAFCNCSSLTGIDLSEVTAIGKWGFQACSSLGVIDAPKLEKLNEDVFRKCGTVSKIDLPSVTDASGAYTLAGITVTEGGSINLPKCTKMGQSMFDKTRANNGTLNLTAAGTFTMNTMAFTNNLFISSTKLVLNVDKKQGGSGSPLVTDNNEWGYQGGSTSLVVWNNISYVDNAGNGQGQSWSK